jgi:hypothetical protein
VTRWPRVAVVGGSLGGLTAALVLRDLGCEVDVFERSTAELEGRGAGIVVLDATVRYFRERTGLDLDRITTSTGFLRYLDGAGAVVYEEPRRYRYSAWQAVHGALLGCLGRRSYHLGMEMVGFDETCWSAPTASPRRPARRCSRAPGRPMPATSPGAARCPRASSGATPATCSPTRSSTR